MSRGKRLQRVEVPSEAIDDYFTGNMAVIEGLPDDATLVNTWEEPLRDMFIFTFESEEFPVVGEGEEIPEAKITTARRRINRSTWWVCDNCHETHENGDVVRN